MAYGFDDGHIAVRTVHSVKHVPTHQSSITRHGKVALSIKYVAANLSSITKIPSDIDCQICHELRHTLGHHVKGRLSVSSPFHFGKVLLGKTGFSKFVNFWRIYLRNDENRPVCLETRRRCTACRTLDVNSSKFKVFASGLRL